MIFELEVSFKITHFIVLGISFKLISYYTNAVLGLALYLSYFTFTCATCSTYCFFFFFFTVKTIMLFINQLLKKKKIS